MTDDTPSMLAELLAECASNDIWLLPSGDDGLTIDATQGALTPNLLDRLSTHKTAILAALTCDTAASDVEDGPTADLSRILPRPHELTPAQRRLWRERTAAYRAEGMSEPDARQEAMAELVMTGKLYNPDDSFPWPK